MLLLLLLPWQSASIADADADAVAADQSTVVVAAVAAAYERLQRQPTDLDQLVVSLQEHQAMKKAQPFCSCQLQAADRPTVVVVEMWLLQADDRPAVVVMWFEALFL